ncbi:MAG: hypothetical protein AAF850_11985 [Pseudomonadota bacterium]
MSDTKGIAGRYAPQAEGAGSFPVARPFQRLFAKPLLPEAGAAGAPLTAVIAVISFLAAIALCAFLLIASAASAWTSALNGSVTVMVKGATAPEISAQTTALVEALPDVPGVTGLNLIDTGEAARLLEPWLGAGDATEYLNVPALIDVQLNDAARSDLKILRETVETLAPEALIDDHSTWRERLVSAAAAGQTVAFFVFCMVLAAACAIAVFAARAGLAANHELVDLLHLMGATDSFIAGEVQRRFLILGGRGATIGVALAAGVYLISRAIAGSAGTANTGFFLANSPSTNSILAFLLIVPVCLCFALAMSARVTVLKSLRKSY